MAADVEKIRRLLSLGIPNEQVASAVGVTPAYISQLLSDEVFANEIAEAKTKLLTASTTRDLSIDAVEDKLVKKLGDLIDSQAFYKPGDILNAFRVVNAAKRRGAPVNPNAGTVVNNIIHLTLPKTAVKTFTMASDGTVVDVGGKTLVSMKAHELLRNLGKSAGAKGSEQYDKVRNYLPAVLEPVKPPIDI